MKTALINIQALVHAALGSILLFSGSALAQNINPPANSPPPIHIVQESSAETTIDLAEWQRLQHYLWQRCLYELMRLLGGAAPDESAAAACEPFLDE